jgi:hypothetical protein
MSASEAATLTASTKRPPAVSGGRVGSPTTKLPALFIVPLLPVGADLVEELQLQNPRELKETCAFANVNNVLPDVAEGDILTVAGVDYLVYYVKEYTRPSEGSFLHILVSLRKAT